MQQAKEGAIKRFPDSPAIVQFDVPVQKLNELSGKVFSSGSSAWSRFVDLGRKNILQHTFDFVEGPYLYNGRAVGHQLAIFTKKAAKLFDNCFSRIIKVK